MKRSTESASIEGIPTRKKVKIHRKRVRSDSGKKELKRSRISREDEPSLGSSASHEPLSGFASSANGHEAKLPEESPVSRHPSIDNHHERAVSTDPKVQSAEEISYTCPICRELLVDPVTLSCGHAVCNGCLRAYVNRDANASCPLDRQVIVRPLPNVSILLRDFLRERFADRYRQRELDMTTAWPEQPQPDIPPVSNSSASPPPPLASNLPHIIRPPDFTIFVRTVLKMEVLRTRLVMPRQLFEGMCTFVLYFFNPETAEEIVDVIIGALDVAVLSLPLPIRFLFVSVGHLNFLGIKFVLLTLVMWCGLFPILAAYHHSSTLQNSFFRLLYFLGKWFVTCAFSITVFLQLLIIVFLTLYLVVILAAGTRLTFMLRISLGITGVLFVLLVFYYCAFSVSTCSICELASFWGYDLCGPEPFVCRILSLKTTFNLG